MPYKLSENLSEFFVVGLGRVRRGAVLTSDLCKKYPNAFIEVPDLKPEPLVEIASVADPVITKSVDSSLTVVELTANPVASSAGTKKNKKPVRKEITDAVTTDERGPAEGVDPETDGRATVEGGSY